MGRVIPVRVRGQNAKTRRAICPPVGLSICRQDRVLRGMGVGEGRDTHILKIGGKRRERQSKGGETVFGPGPRVAVGGFCIFTDQVRLSRRRVAEPQWWDSPPGLLLVRANSPTAYQALTEA